jgi:hypothetical protein
MKALGYSLLIFVSVLIGLLTTYVVLDVSKLYNITQITSLGFAKIYALICIISLVFHKREKNDNEDETPKEKTIRSVVTMAEKLAMNLFVWGFMYIMSIFLL